MSHTLVAPEPVISVAVKIDDHVCFPLPLNGASSANPEELRWNETSRGTIAQEIRPYSRLGNPLSGLSTRGIEVMSRFVPTLMCGEESAVHVFQKEAKRVNDIRAHAASSALLAQIAAEEIVHERLLTLLRNLLPAPDDLADLRRRARFFFFRLASRDPSIHFARIAGLDGGVCITLSSLLQPFTALARAPQAYEIWDRIWRDEARHVRISRQHVLDLGIDEAKLNEEGMRARKGLVELLRPLADDFEDIKVDPDKLFRRIAGFEEV